ncbi:hypothetical protein I4F81_002020 [Pyropia yezoensis]|uniref:Uncharacterized protein n=1 Tax=Pyropia yezoensis TaxID=2788 RepID=A0ACC3BNB9_PYRYE|nr:hypothetical protein I4F81_002020 [Neopyropia yezoensis]
MTTTFQCAKVEEVAELLAGAFHVSVAALDISTRVTSSKHILNQPADVNAELVKKALNPDAKQWSWLARNVVLRSSLALGSPATSVLCPKELSIADVGAIAEATAQLTTVEAPMPQGCTSVATRGAPGNGTIIEMIEWSWSNVHVADPDFHLVSRLLSNGFLGGSKDGGAAATSLSDGGAPVTLLATPARGGRPPTSPANRGTSAGGQSGRGTKRAEAEPVVSSPTSVRKLRHRKAAAKYARTLEVAASILVEQEQRATVVRPPLVVGRVKPFCKWPFGGVVVFAQFPFLLDPTSKKTATWTAYCKKVLILKKGGRYEIVFKPKKVPTEASVGRQNGNEPLVGAGDSVAASAAAVGADVVPAAGTAGGRAAEGAGAFAGENEGVQVPDEESDDDEEVGPAAATVAHPGHQVRASVVRRSTPPAAPVGPAGEEAGAAEDESEVVGRSSGGASMTSSGGTPLVGAGDPTSSAGGATATPTDSWDATDFAVADLFEDDPDASVPEFSPLPDTLQGHFITTLEKSKAWGTPEDDEQVEWSVITRSPPSCFTLVCTFASSMDLGRSQSLPCGTHRSSNMVTCAYPARDPRDEEAMELV